MRIGVVGAGAIGRFVAAELSEGGEDVVLLAHRPGAKPVAATRVDGRRVEQRAPIAITTNPRDLERMDVVLVAVKAADTDAVAQALASILSPEAVVVSFQNGLENAPRLRRALGARVAAGVVTYNVFLDANGAVSQSTAGPLLAEALPAPHAAKLTALAHAFARGGDDLELRHDIDRVQEGKLLVNLNNGVCAATGLGIAASLRDRDARACFAMCLDEGWRVMRAAGRRPARVTALPPFLLARALRLPDALVSMMSRRLAKVGEDARSSTLQDLDRGRATEIDELNGAIVAIARRRGTRAPANETITEVVHEHEREAMEGRRPSFVPPRQLRERLERAVHTVRV